jgi:hypothetical protein
MSRGIPELSRTNAISAARLLACNLILHNLHPGWPNNINASDVSGLSAVTAATKKEWYFYPTSIDLKGLFLRSENPSSTLHKLLPRQVAN